MKIKAALNDASISLNRLEAEVLLAHICKKPRAFLYTYPETLLSITEIREFVDCINKRILGYPVAYLIGKKEFWSLPLKVNENTLIPRPETELLVEVTLSLLQDTISLLELATGSGAISLALAKERPNWKINASDINELALTVAEHNRNTLNIKNLEFICSDWFHSIPPQKFCAIIANPPYLAQDDQHLQQGDLRFEPRNALIAGKTGLEAFAHIINVSKQFLQPDGWLILEHGYTQKNQVTSLLEQAGYYKIQSWVDLYGHERVLSAQNAVSSLDVSAQSQN